VWGVGAQQIPIRLRSGQALGFARDDKGEGGAPIDSRYLGWTERLNGRSFLSQLATASRLLGMTRGEGGASIDSRYLAWTEPLN